MGSGGEVEQLQRVLEFAIGSDVRFQDTPWVVNGVACNSKGEMSFQLFKSPGPNEILNQTKSKTYI